MNTLGDKVFGVAISSMSIAGAIFVVGLIASGAWTSMPWFMWPFAVLGAGFGVTAGVWIGVWSFRWGFSR